MVICHSGEVELDPLDFKLTTITLQDDPDSNLRHSIGLRPTFISTPPLSIHLLPIGLDTWLCNGRGDSPSYELHASATANAGSFTAPSYLSMLDLYWLSPCRTVTTIRTGVLCFVPAEGAKAPSKYGFLVVLSVQLPQVPPLAPLDYCGINGQRRTRLGNLVVERRNSSPPHLSIQRTGCRSPLGAGSSRARHGKGRALPTPPGTPRHARRLVWGNKRQ